MKNIIDEGRNDQHIFKAIFTIGFPGAGKSTIGNHIIGGTGLKRVNPDELHEYLIKIKKPVDFNDIDKKTNLRLSIYVDGRLGLLIDRTGNTKEHIIELKLQLEEIGYSCAMVFIYADPNIAKQRTIDRAKEIGRVVDDEYFDTAVQNIQKNVSDFQKVFGNNFIKIDNGNDKPDLSFLDKRINQFFKEPLNSIANSWIKQGKGDNLNESQESYKFCSTQINVPFPMKTDLLNYGDQLDPHDLNESEGGKETEPHITILYGIKSVKGLQDINRSINKIRKSIPIIKVKLGKISAFETNPEFDVLKVDVESKELKALNQFFRSITEFESSYPTYIPHLTIAYLNKGTAKKYIGDDRFENQEFQVTEFLFCNTTGEKNAISLRNIASIDEINITLKDFFIKN